MICVCLSPPLTTGMERAGFFVVERLKFFFRFWHLLGCWVLSWWTSKLCIVGELAGGGSVAVGVGVKCHASFDTWHGTCDTWILSFDFLVLVLLPAHIKRFVVSCMRDSYLLFSIQLENLLKSFGRDLDWISFIQRTHFSKLDYCSSWTGVRHDT